jgi:LysM repeat protein
MKMPKLFPHRKKLRAATARRAAGSAEMDYEEMSEPNMKLSRALLIVLLLHVVAVSGIIAFNAIKTRQSSFVPAAQVNTETKPTAATVGSTINPDISRPKVAQKGNEPRDEARASHPPLKPLAKDENAKPAQHATVPTRSGKVYTVVKGDNPVTIAKKLKVSYDDLVALNQIEDPRKLKIGQKLLIPKTTKPTEPKKPKKSHE